MSTWETRDKLEDHCKKHGDEVAAIRGATSIFKTKDYATSCNQTVSEALIILEYEDSNHFPKGEVRYSMKSCSYFDRNSLVSIEVPNRRIFKTHFPNGCQGLADCRIHATRSLDVKLEMYRKTISKRIENGRYNSVAVKQRPTKWTLVQN